MTAAAALWRLPPGAGVWSAMVLSRPVSPSVERGRIDRLRLGRGFAGWMMGLIDGRVTGLGAVLHRAAQLRALGNGGILHQAAHAVTTFWCLTRVVGILVADPDQPIVA